MSKQYLLYLLVSIIVVLCGVLYYLYSAKNINQKTFGKINPKCLVVIYGESFKIHEPEKQLELQNLYIQQKIATLSHIDLINNIHWKYKIDTDVILSTKSNHYKNEIKGWFQEYLWSNKANVKTVMNNMTSDTLENIFKNTNMTEVKKYAFVLFIKSDAYLKPAFFDIFDPHSKQIVFTSRDSIYDHSINNATAYIPYYKFDKIFKEGKKTELNKNLNLNVIEFVKEYDLKDEHEVGFMIDKGYDKDTSKVWNPLYKTVNTPEISTPSM